MPNIKSAAKRVRVNAAKTIANRAIKSEIKTVLKKADVAINTKSEDMAEVAKAAVKKVDQACAKGIMHKNKASRKKSQIALRLNSASN